MSPAAAVRRPCVTCRAWGAAGVLCAFAAGVVTMLAQPWSPPTAVVLIGTAMAVALPCRGEHRGPGVARARRKPDVPASAAPACAPPPMPGFGRPPLPRHPGSFAGPAADPGPLMLEPDPSGGRHGGGPNSLVSTTLRDRVDERLTGARRAPD